MGISQNITQELLKSISYLDAFSGSNGNLSAKGVNMTTNPEDRNIVEFIEALSECRNSICGNEESKIVIKNVYDTLLPYLGRLKFKELIGNKYDDKDVKEEQIKSFQELYNELDSLIGLADVKSAVNNLVSYHKVQNHRKNAGLKIPNRTLHIAFTGNPGTGKTTVARILGRMYKELGLLSKGHFIEVSRTDLIAGYQGQTALKVKEVIRKAKGGVLFIDEAYSLTENDHSDSYGRECLTELTKGLEDCRDDLVVIVAGYSELMTNFFESNPGLKSRFNTFIEFPNYSSDELLMIFQKMCYEDDYKLEESALPHLNQIIYSALEENNDRFANGRFVRNLYEKVIMNQAKRLINNCNPTKEDLLTIKNEDITSL